MSKYLILAALALLLSACAGQGGPSANPRPALYTDQTGIVFVRVPAGRFQMGTAEPIDELMKAYPDLESRRALQLRDETPAHPVQIGHDFYLGKYEVTVDHFARFVKESGYVAESMAPALMATTPTMTAVAPRRQTPSKGETPATAGATRALCSLATSRSPMCPGTMRRPWRGG